MFDKAGTTQICLVMLLMCCFGLTGALDLAPHHPHAAKIFGAFYIAVGVLLTIVILINERSEER